VPGFPSNPMGRPQAPVTNARRDRRGNSSQVSAALKQAPAAGAAVIIADMTAARFRACDGVRALAGARAAAVAAGPG
jgi:hypothetical protein